MNQPLSIQINSDSIHALRLEFFKSSDRWSHRWLLIDAGEEIEILKSLEGDPDQNWPPSPPMQDVSLEDLGFGNAILGVGMAGKSHWSASYSIENKSIKSDLACLQKQIDGESKLCSTYQLGSSVEARNESTDAPAENALKQNSTNPNSENARLRLKANGVELALIPFADEASTTDCQINEGQIRILPCNSSNSPVKAIRWGFVLELLG